jgi:hypothetical protein
MRAQMTTWEQQLDLGTFYFEENIGFLIITFEYRREMCWICH